MNAKEYVEKIVKYQGKNEAKRIIEATVKLVQAASSVYFYNEAEWTVDKNGKHELSQTQSKKVTSIKERRDRKNVFFWNECLRLIKSV